MNKTGEGIIKGGGGGGDGRISMKEVSNHNSKDSCWVVVGGVVLDVTKFLKEHPGGELAILTFAGKDATEEFNMIHPPDVIDKYAPDARIGVIGSGEDQNEGCEVLPPVFSMEDVSKHNNKNSCWVVVSGSVLDVTKFLKDHPGGELAILTFAGKDASDEFNTIHPPDVIDKYAPDARIGIIGSNGVREEDHNRGGAGLQPELKCFSLEEVSKHNSASDCWVVVAGQVLNVTKFLKEHPGGELAIVTFAGKDATEEFGMIHPPDVIKKYAPDAVIGTICAAALAGGHGGGDEASTHAGTRTAGTGSGSRNHMIGSFGCGQEDQDKSGAAFPTISKGLSMEEVSRHNKASDCWVVVASQVLNVTKFLKEHPGGELAILTFAGKDATEEFAMIHPPDVIGKYAPDAVIGMILAPVAAGGEGEDGAAANAEAIQSMDMIVRKSPDTPIGINVMFPASGGHSDSDGVNLGGSCKGACKGGDGAGQGCVISMEDVAKHNNKESCWVVVDGVVLDVTKFLKEHPGGELAILTFAGKDASEEFSMIHPPDVINKYAPDSRIGVISSDRCGEGSHEVSGGLLPAGVTSFTIEEVSKHNNKDSCWVVVGGSVLDVTKFLKDHPGGELAILTFAGKDATEEFNMIHPSDVVNKYAPDARIGIIGSNGVREEDHNRGGTGLPAEVDAVIGTVDAAATIAGHYDGERAAPHEEFPSPHLIFKSAIDTMLGMVREVTAAGGYGGGSGDASNVEAIERIQIIDFLPIL